MLTFTGKERDSETGLDWFESRYFGAAQGRFTSPDALLAKKRNGSLIPSVGIDMRTSGITP